MFWVCIYFVGLIITRCFLGKRLLLIYIFERGKILKRFKFTKISFYAIFILSPVVLLLFLSCIYKCNAFIGRPTWSDEVSYWREVFSFSNFGVKTGYFGVQEIIPRIGRFSTHGFFPSLFYFPFAKLLGWGDNGLVISNLLFTIICFFILICFIKPSLEQTFGLILLYLFYPPILLYVATSMTEIVNYGLLSLFFVFFYLYYNANDKRSKKLFLVLMIFVGTVCSFYRITYVVLFILPVIALFEMKSRKFILLTFLWIFYSGFLYYISSLFTAPYPYGFLYNVMHTGNLKLAIHLILFNTSSNITRLFNIKYGEYIEIFFRAFYIIAIILYFSLIFFKATTQRNKKNFLSISFRGKVEKFYLMQFTLLVLPLCIVVLIYDVYGFRDYRVLSPFLWASLLNLILFRRRVTFLSLMPIFILFFSASLFFCPQGFCLSVDDIPMRELRYGQSKQCDFSLINEVVKYDETAAEPFENTILVDNFDFAFWSNLHPGIGIEFGGIQDNLKSKYILINIDNEICGYTCKGATEFGYLYTKN